MRICFNTPVRLVSGATLATILNLSLGACSPVVLQEESESDSTAGSTGGSSGASEGGSEGGTAEGGSAEGGEGGVVPEACIDLEPRVLGVLETNCAKCHGAGSAAQGGIDYILDLGALIAADKVVPGQADNSRIYARMTAMMNPMPPIAEVQRPTLVDIESVGKWIDQCAGVQSCGDQEFITREQMLAKINQDLGSGAINLQNIKFTRYFSFVHLHNAGWCDSEIEIFREALTKLVNSLSQETLIRPPIAIDEERLIYRIDISDYDWDADIDAQNNKETFKLSEPSFYFSDGSPDISVEEQAELDKNYIDKWEMIADQNPYNIEFLGELATSIKNQTDTDFPVMQGDAFLDVASRSPLYYDILGIPLRSAQLRKTDPPCAGNECLETQLGINILADIDDELLNDKAKVARAGFHESDVSDFNRVIERHRFTDASNRVFWLSYDFGSESQDANIGVNPLDFDFDGGEIIFNLPNGLQGYMLTDAAGKRLNEGPINIVQDESQRDFLVRNGVSCMGCHSAGMIKVQDDVRHELDNGQTETQFNDEEKDDIRRLYPTRDEFDGVLAEDVKRFNDALTVAGVPVGGEKEPIITTFLSFDEDVGLRRAGAEFGLREQDMAKDVGKLSLDLSELSKAGGTIQRRDFTANYGESACLLNIGRTRACPSPNPKHDPTQPL